MKKLYSILAILIIAVFVLTACSPAEAPQPPPQPTQPEATQLPATPKPVVELATPEELATAETAPVEETKVSEIVESIWDQAYIDEVPPIVMIEPYFQIFGQSKVAVPYYYEGAVKLAGHSCGATTGAWIITKKALDALYPGDEIPVRGQIKVEAPGAEDEWFTGVFGEIIAYVTGAAPKTGFIGAEFGEANDLFIRQNKMTYPETATGTQPPKMEWIFTRTDTGRKVSVNFNLAIITPIATEDRQAMGAKLAKGLASQEEADDYYQYWNDRAKFVLENQDMDGFFTVKNLDEGATVVPSQS